MKILCSGTHGFLGGAAAQHYLSKGEVRSIPRDMLYDRWDLQRYLEAEKPDYILHFAAYGNHSTQTELGEIVEANIHCTLNLLEASKNVDYKCFINTSTSSVLLPKQTFYSASKMATEYFCKAFQSLIEKPIVSIRPFSVYGPGEASHRFIPTLINAAKNNNRVLLTPEPVHDWIFIDDFVEAVDIIIQNSWKLAGKSINIGTGIQTSNQRVFDIVQEISGKQIRCAITKDMRHFDTDSWKADNSLLVSLGWTPKYSVFEGVKKTYDSITMA